MIAFRNENEEYNNLPDISSDSNVKAAVRARDGHRCRDCGMTSEKHVSEYDQELHVHRLIPGSIYWEEGCVTLCMGCHGVKPRKTAECLWKGDLRWFAFNLYDAEDMILYEQLRGEALGSGRNLSEVFAEVFRQHYAGAIERDRQDLLMQADGLW